MDTAKFFEKFELFAHPEEAAKHFREVVLNLAFSGKLKGTDLSGWETYPIGDFFTEGLKSINAPDTPNQTYELWSVPSFETGAPEIVTGAQVGSTKRELRDGTILLGKINPHLNRIWVVKRRTNHPMIASQEWINITAGDTWDTGYLARLLSSPSFNRSICATAQGMGSLTRANTKQVAQILVHRPPLREQKKLIAKVDELMALCDRLEAQLKDRDVKQAALAKAALAKFTEDPTPENLQLLFHPSFSIEPDELRKTVLGLGVNGQLTERIATGGTAEELLRLIHEEKLTMFAAKTARQGKVSKSNDSCAAPVAVPKGWKWTNIDSICFKVTDGTHFTPKYASKGVRFVSAKDIIDGRLSFERCKYITQEEHDQLYRRCNPELNNIVISKSGSIGSVAIVEDKNEFSLFESLALLKFNTKYVLPRFLAHALTHACESLTAGQIKGVGVKHLHLDILRGLEVGIPPLAEQQRIIEKTDALLKLVDQLEAQIEASHTTGEKLLEAMVAELTSA